MAKMNHEVFKDAVFPKGSGKPTGSATVNGVDGLEKATPTKFPVVTYVNPDGVKVPKE